MTTVRQTAEPTRVQPLRQSTTSTVPAAPQPPADMLQASPEARETAVRARVEKTLLGVRALPKEQLPAVARDAESLLALPGLSKETQGLLELQRAAAYGQLALMKVDRKANGKVAFQAVSKAIDLAPARMETVLTHARSVLGISKLNWLFRKVVSGVVGMNTKDEAKRSVKLLAAFPQDPTCQLVRKSLAQHAGDKAALKETEALLKQLEAQDPAGFKAALKALAGDDDTAKKAEAESDDQ